MSRLTFRDALTFPRIQYDDIINNGAQGAYLESPDVRTFTRTAPFFHDHPDQPSVLPTLDNRSLNYPPAFTLFFRDATLLGYRSLIVSGWQFTNDQAHLSARSARDFCERLPKSAEKSFMQADGDAFIPSPLQGDTIHLDGPVVVLTSMEAGNFGSFLYRELVKLANLREIPNNWRFLLHISSPNFLEFLELAGISRSRVIHHDCKRVYRIEQAIVPGLRIPLAYADPESHALYQKISEIKRNRFRQSRRVYISRSSITSREKSGQSTRAMMNEGELIEALKPLGFEIVEPQSLNAAEQVACFANADMIVGPAGSGLFNAVFCQPGTRLIDIESEPHWVFPHSCLFSSAKLRYGIFEGVSADQDWSSHHKPWRVNIAKLLQRIETGW